MSQQQQRQLESGLFEQRFFVPGDLVGLAIGKEGVNVDEVRRMDGIVSVEFEDHSSMFRVRAEVSRLVWVGTRAWCHEGVCFTFFLRHKRRWPEQESDCSTQKTQSSSQETLQVGAGDIMSPCLF